MNNEFTELLTIGNVTADKNQYLELIRHNVSCPICLDLYIDPHDCKNCLTGALLTKIDLYTYLPIARRLSFPSQCKNDATPNNKLNPSNSRNKSRIFV